ncbi:MAG: putative ABC transporter permease [Spirochaetaceae bacterium]|nr:putative ABC transporter permease [Spirochaetaceae bacterium]
MIDKQIIYFFIYCFAGWICEIFYCAMLEKHFTNRGFLRGPYLPIYGSGAMSIIYVVSPIFSNPILIFIFSLIVCSLIEYIGSLILEKAFHIKLWDYSNYFANINGRICLLNSSLFGVFGIVLVYFIHPVLVNSVDLLSQLTRYYLSTAIEILLTFDFALSVMRMNAFAIAMEDIRIKSEELQQRVESISANSPKNLREAKERLEDELYKQKAILAVKSSKIFSAFPTMKYKDSQTSLSLELFKMDLKSFVAKGKEENQKRSENVNVMYENAKARVKNARKK